MASRYALGAAVCQYQMLVEAPDSAYARLGVTQAATHQKMGDALRRAEEKATLMELQEVYGFSAEEAQWELENYKREQQGGPPLQQQFTTAPPTAAPPAVPNFIKRQMALEQGVAYTPQRANGSRAGPTKSSSQPVTSYPRGNLSSVAGGIFAPGPLS